MSIRIVACQTEYAANPLGIDTSAPRLFWQLDSAERSAVQTGYRVLVATDRQLLARDKADM